MNDNDDMPTIEATGNVSPDGVYTMRISGLPTAEHANRLAILMQPHIATVVQEVMQSSPAEIVGAAVPDAIMEALKAAGATDVFKIDAANPEEAQEQLKALFERVAGPCECPNCSAERARGIRVETDPTTRH